MLRVTHEQIALLINVQRIEIESERIKKNMATVEQRMNRLDDQLKALEETIQQEQRQLDAVNQTYRNHESDIKINLANIEKSEAKLRSVKTNKEYQSGLKEIDDLKAINSRIEDEMLNCLDEIDRLEQTIRQGQEELDQRAAQIEREKEVIQQEVAEDKQRLSELETDWKSNSERVDDNLLRIYLQKKPHYPDGCVIVPVRNAVCQGCHLNIPPQMYNELHHGDSLKNCPNCERMIYKENTNDSSNSI
jgi:hypothetical protein